MPAAKGKAEIRFVAPDALKARLDAEAIDRGMDRSALICQRLQDALEGEETAEVARRLGELARDSAVMRDALKQLHEDLTQVVTLIETFMAAVGKPSTPAEKVYPTPATFEEIYPELYAPKPPEPVTPRAAPQPAAKGWLSWRR
jgi:hypothetical protein